MLKIDKYFNKMTNRCTFFLKIYPSRFENNEILLLNVFNEIEI